MGLMDLFKGKSNKANSNLSLAQLLNDTPIFSQFGDDVYASDVVRSCIHAIASECSKVELKHIRIGPDGVMSNPPSSLNSIFNYRANPLMTVSDFITKVVWRLMLDYNAFIYPIYEVYEDGNGNKKKRYKAFYPLNPTHVEFLQDPKGKMYVRLRFTKGDEIVKPYDEIIHLRHQYSINDIMGGDDTGNPNNTALLKLLETDSIVVEGLGIGVKSSLVVRGILKYNSILSDGNQEDAIKEFEEKLSNTASGIIPTDLKAEFTEIKVDPKLVDSDTMEFVENRILRNYGTSAAIVSGDFNEDQYQAFYEKTLEPLLNSFSQAFTASVFSEREIAAGNKIAFYPKNMMYLSVNSKLAILKTAGEQGLLTNDQKLQILGLPPIGGEEGAVRTMSLNFVDTRLANEYQMAKANAPQLSVTGGSNNEK